MAQGFHQSEDERVATEGSVDSANLLADNQSLRDRLMRALAEAENVRRRNERSLDETRQYSIAQFAREMLGVVDNLRRAIDAAEGNSGRSVPDAALLDGVRATERILELTLDRFGIRKIDAIGAPFDPALHEAVMEIADPSHKPGSIGKVIENGYRIQDRLLRPARVAVVKGPAQTHDPDNQPNNPQP